MVFGLNIWQFLLIVAALEMILAPFIIFIFRGYYQAKYGPLFNYINAVMKGVANAFEKAADTLQARMTKESNK